MPNDPLAPLTPGAPLPTSARAWNPILRAAAAHEKRTAGVSGRPAPALVAGELVHNGTMEDIPRFGVVGIDETVITPTDESEADFLRGPLAFEGVVPDWDAHRGRFGVALEPLPAGSVRRVALTGLARVKVDFGDRGPMPRADIIDGEVEHLLAGTTGGAEILWHDGDAESGVAWCVVRLGPRATTRVEARIHTPTSLGTNRWSYSATIGAFGAGGAWADGSVTVMARNRAELFNDASGVQGSGVDLANLLGSFAHVPPGEIIVSLEGPYDVDGSPFFYFGSQVQTDGECS